MKYMILFLLLSTPCAAESVLSSVSANVVDVTSISQDPNTGKITVTNGETNTLPPTKFETCDATQCTIIYAY